MIHELTAGRARQLGLVTRALTPIVKGGARRLLKWRPEGSVTVQLPTGQKIRFGQPGQTAEAELRLHNYGLLAKALRRGTIGVADAYIDGDVECPDLTALFRFFLTNVDKFEQAGGGLFRARMADRVAHLFRRNTHRGSRRNISEHYDLGNDFYRLWLDRDMNYSSALYTRGGASLEEAQRAKLDLILDFLELAGGESVLEIGCGWGAFARRAAARHGARVTGVTLSHEQLAHARRQAALHGLDDRCAFRLQDYRDVTGHYDRIVSIEMVEAVGEENWRRYFDIVHDRLKPGSTAAIQSITIDERRFEKYRRKADFIQRYIFPGGMLPTPERLARHAGRAGLSVDRVETFGACYARTLGAWQTRFETAWPDIAKLGFDERFCRKWRYYLAYCEAGFAEGAIDVGVYRLRKS
ncbi:MAG: cyclopropane-fatty-acyl-phospholipid synthase family protein [Hyphomicrobiales bacterium]|nr:cyclopropane-fatty-acyl-phospholipid synthase family protein [Hyphomicrobiales bacterium]